MANGDPLPYFRWYWRDAREDWRYQRLTPAQRGVLHDVMDECWKEGSVELDYEKLSIVTRATPDDLREMWPMLAPLFYEISAGQFTSPRLERERTDVDRKRAQAKRAGKLGGKAKAQGQLELVAVAKRTPSERHIAVAVAEQSIADSSDRLATATNGAAAPDGAAPPAATEKAPKNGARSPVAAMVPLCRECDAHVVTVHVVGEKRPRGILEHAIGCPHYSHDDAQLIAQMRQLDAADSSLSPEC